MPTSEPGQFVQLLCRDDDADGALHEWRADGFPSIQGQGFNRRTAYLRRPFSIADHIPRGAGPAQLTVISHTIGPGTRWLETLRPNDSLNITGPLGVGFRVPQPGVPLILIGGGVGIPPLLYLARRLHEQQHKRVAVIVGARSADLLPIEFTATPDAAGTPTPCVVYPGGARYATLITTDDGTQGLRGRVTDALNKLVSADKAWSGATVLACGPDAMLRAIAGVTKSLNLACQLCIERNMGCGLGTCLSCIVRRREPNAASGWRWALACQEGPVFDRDDLLDYAANPGA